MRKQSLLLGFIGLILPPYILWIDNNSLFGGVKGFIAFAFFYTVAWIETSGIFVRAMDSGFLFKLFNPNWYLNPDKIIANLSDFQDTLNWFILDFYGDMNEGTIIHSTAGILMGITLILAVMALLLSAIEKHEASIIAYILVVLLQAAAFLDYFSNSNLYDAMIPFGVIAYLIAIILEWMARH